MRATRSVMLILVALTLLPSVGRGDDASAQSEQEMQRGIELRRLGKDVDALEAFQRAYALHPTPRTVAQMALARQALADWVEAERGTEEALRATDDPWITRYRDVLERALATVRRHLATLYVEANVTQGELFLNGAFSGPLPAPGQPLRVVAGTLNFEVRAPGYATFRRTLDVSAGGQVQVVITLDPAASPESTIAADASQETPVNHAQRVASLEPIRESSQAPRRDDASRRTWGYVALAAAGVLTGGGVIAWRVREDNASIYDDNSRCLMGTQTRDEQCGAHADAANIALGFEIGAFAAAAASAAVGAWFLWKPKTRSSSVSTTCAPWRAVGFLCTTPF